ncbi:hypothetical protein GCM10022227_16050 [Streptomyces sedi]
MPAFPGKRARFPARFPARFSARQEDRLRETGKLPAGHPFRGLSASFRRTSELCPRGQR